MDCGQLWFDTEHKGFKDDDRNGYLQCLEKNRGRPCQSPLSFTAPIAMRFPLGQPKVE